ncbi:MAG: AraC family transcriptional regulator [Verrucomicrobia bacterium]|nr:AraC family transcriptional regulator [Verrucomicrobiota bacterium]MDA1069237.1 AraC family transcriptional regulator [Verrucomicrobiota bacterium]
MAQSQKPVYTKLYVLHGTSLDGLTGYNFQEAFFEQYPFARNLFALFEYHPTAYFHAKDAQHRFVALNHLVCREVFGCDSPEVVLGHTDLEFQPPHLAEAYHAEDRRVMAGKKTIPNEIWLVPHVDGSPKWYCSTKTPLADNDGEVIGTAGIMYPVETPGDRVTFFKELAPVISYLEKHFTSDVSMKDMAGLAGLSSTQYNLRFRQLLRMTPTEYLMTLRIDLAQHLLTRTDKKVADIGVAVGFYDQSQFTKIFKKHAGITPKAYRKRFR